MTANERGRQPVPIAVPPLFSPGLFHQSSPGQKYLWRGRKDFLCSRSPKQGVTLLFLSQCLPHCRPHQSQHVAGQRFFPGLIPPQRKDTEDIPNPSALDPVHMHTICEGHRNAPVHGNVCFQHGSSGLQGCLGLTAYPKLFAASALLCYRWGSSPWLKS